MVPNIDAYSNEHCRLGWNYDKGGPLYLQENLAISEYALKSASYGRRVDDLFSAGDRIICIDISGEIHPRKNSFTWHQSKYVKLNIANLIKESYMI